jgi:hypothetical protein
MKSVKRTAEKIEDLVVIVQSSASRTPILPLFIPAVNCWATIIRPLCGLIKANFLCKAYHWRFASRTTCLPQEVDHLCDHRYCFLVDLIVAENLHLAT